MVHSLLLHWDMFNSDEHDVTYVKDMLQAVIKKAKAERATSSVLAPKTEVTWLEYLNKKPNGCQV